MKRAEGEEDLLKELANVILEHFEGTIDHGDPIEIYLKKLMSHFHSENPKLFRSRFSRGYIVLLEQLQKQADTEF